MVRQKYVDKEAQKEAQETFTYWQSEYNKTGDVSILWEHLEPLFRACAGPCILKINMHHEVKNLQDKIDDTVLMLLERYKKKPAYNFGSLSTLVYFAAFYICRKENTVAEEMTSFYSYEDLLEKGMHEDHVLSTEFGNIGQQLNEIRGDVDNEQRRIGEDEPQTKLCTYRAISRGKNKVWTIYPDRGTRQTTEGHRYKCIRRIRRCESEEK